MASIPPSQRPSPTSQRSSNSSSSQNQAPEQCSTPAESQDSETVLLGPSTPRPSLPVARTTSQSAVEKPSGTAQDPNDVRRCWICFSDETDDTPLSSSWRSPCPCALTAHESCLLDWVADIEVSNTGLPKKILCPQCKSEITIARPRSVLVDIVRALEGAASRLVLPAILTLGGSTVLYLSLSYGIIAVRMVLGPEDFGEMFHSPVDSPAQITRRVFGLSIVPWTLILSRTSIADSILPIVPMLFFVTQPKPDPLVDFSSWPPSAGLSFALLPYARAAYNTYYEQVWGERERKWLEEVKPRSNSDGRRDDAFELEIGLDNVDDDEDQAAQQDGQDGGEGNQAHPLDAPPLDQPEAPEPQLPQGIPGLGEGQHQHHRRLDYSISLVRVAQSVIGALVFPSISAVMGDVLRSVLPASWTQLPWLRAKPTRFLQTRWGRSLVGGCLFVVLKDAVTLYVKWKMAQNHRHRRVVDYDRSRKIKGR